jgi:hypothetical protein
MTFPDLGASQNFYVPNPLGVKELNLDNDWRGRWVEMDELPDHAPVDYAYAAVLMGDKGYVTRPRGENTWRTVEGGTGTEKPEAFLKRAIKEQIGATIARTEMLGFLECRATQHHPELPKDTIRVRPVYLVVAKKVDDLGAESPYERRRLPMNEYLIAVRNRYPERADQFGEAGQRYAVLRAKGEA